MEASGTAKRAIDIFALMKDGQWHTATQIGDALGISPFTARNIIRACSESWHVISHKKRGYRLWHNFCPICDSRYETIDNDYAILHQCPNCDWGMIEET